MNAETLLSSRGVTREADSPVLWRDPKVLASIGSGILLLVAFFLGLLGLPDLVQTMVFVAAIVLGGYFFGREALEELLEGEIGVELLMSIAAVTAAVMGQPGEGAMLAFLYSISESAEGYTEKKTRHSVRALMDLAPKTASLRRDGQAVWGLIALRDTIRANAAEAIRAMRRQGVEKVVMLTGDNPLAAQAVAGELGIDETHADLKPEEKAGIVRELVERYGHVAMVGDGVNDAPALAEASLGVAMGAAGTDVALETADVALMADDLNKMASAIHLAKRSRTVVGQNLILSAVVISALVVGAILGAFSLPGAVLGHEISEFVVIGNGLRMLRA